MTSTDSVAVLSIAMSLAATLGCLMLVPAIYFKGVDISLELSRGVKEFDVIAAEAWRQVLRSKRDISKIDDPQVRKMREIYFTPYAYAYYNKFNVVAAVNAKLGVCQCNENNLCPPGPTGAAGQNGVPGETGLTGKPGLKGQAYVIRPKLIEKLKEPCRKCPPGPRGLSGSNGQSGQRGEKGRPGINGHQGRDGYHGPLGPHGTPGSTGAEGKHGGPGASGREAVRYSKGASGEKGYTGAYGLPGQIGLPGRPGLSGQQGAPGPGGPPSREGKKGTKGPVGKPGGTGPIGKDAQYCHCPPKRSIYGRHLRGS